MTAPAVTDPPTLAIGLDMGKDLPWVTALNERGTKVLDQAVPNTPAGAARLLAALQALGGERTVGLDLLGGIATLFTATLLLAGERVVHVPGRTVNRARQGTRGGAHKSDPKDAYVIAEQVRTRPTEFRPLTASDQQLAALRLLVTRRRTLTVEQTRRLAQLHEVLLQVHPGLDRRLQLRGRRAGLWLLTRFVTPTEIRAAGLDGLLAWLAASPWRLPHRGRLAERALEAAAEQQIVLPGEAVAASVVRDLATEALATMDKLHALERALEAELGLHPEAPLIRSLPGLGVVTTAEHLAHGGSVARYPSAAHLAAAVGAAPTLYQTGRQRWVYAARGGNKALKRAHYQAALVAVQRHPTSKAYYDRKRREGKTHRQAMVALVRKRLGVLYAMLRDGQPYREPAGAGEAAPAAVAA